MMKRAEAKSTKSFRLHRLHRSCVMVFLLSVWAVSLRVSVPVFGIATTAGRGHAKNFLFVSGSLPKYVTESSEIM